MPGTGLFGALDASLSGMFGSRLATQVTNHNIANANTPGYSRQSLRLGTARPLFTTYGAIGRGTRVDSISRAQNTLLQNQVVHQNAMLGTYDELNSALQSVEDILGSTDNDRLGNALRDFFDSYSDLATPPITDAKRQSVVSQAQSLAQQFRDISSSLTDLERDNRAAVRMTVDDTNSLLRQVAELNSQIVAHNSDTAPPNDLIDRRDQLLDELSGITRFDVQTRFDGSVDVLVEGRTLVTRGNVNELRVDETTGVDGRAQQAVRFGGKNPVTIEFESGSLAGRSRMTNEILPGIHEDLDQLARSVMDQVNSLHREGVTSGGSGIDFFTGTDASTFKVNEAVANDHRLVATGRTDADGDNSLALEIAGLLDSVIEGRDETLNDQYSSMIVDVATQRSNARNLAESQASIVQSTRNRLDAERGVNLDEELANLMMYQRSYEANAKVISVIDEMLNTLVNGMI